MDEQEIRRRYAERMKHDIYCLCISCGTLRAIFLDKKVENDEI